MKYSKRLFFTILLCIVACACNAQRVYTKQDSLIFERYITDLSAHQDKPLSELIILTGKYFLDSPYVAATLEQEDKESLVINLREFDCTTFVENCIALSHEMKRGDSATFTSYMDFLKKIRYRDGEIDDYSSRLHYSSDWAYENSDLLENITLNLGGMIVDKPLNFMSAHSHLYPRLKANEENRKEIEKIEEMINQRNSYSILPVSKIKQAEKEIKTGDIVIFGTKVKGLDYSHIGIVFWEKGVLKLLHASSARKKVVVDTKSLAEYCRTSKTCTGITVLRLKEN